MHWNKLISIITRWRDSGWVTITAFSNLIPFAYWLQLYKYSSIVCISHEVLMIEHCQQINRLICHNQSVSQSPVNPRHSTVQSSVDISYCVTHKQKPLGNFSISPYPCAGADNVNNNDKIDLYMCNNISSTPYMYDDIVWCVRVVVAIQNIATMRTENETKSMHEYNMWKRKAPKIMQHRKDSMSIIFAGKYLSYKWIMKMLACGNTSDDYRVIIAECLLCIWAERAEESGRERERE